MQVCAGMNYGRRGGAETSPNFQPEFYLYFFALMCFYDSADISATFLRDAVGLALAAFHFYGGRETEECT